MNRRPHTIEQCNSRIEELEEMVADCDEAIDLIDGILAFTFSTGNAREAREAMLRVRADAEQAIKFWASRRPLL